MADKYFAAIMPDEEGSYFIVFPDLLGICTYGRSLSDAYDNCVDALACHLQGMYNDNDTIPKPSPLNEAKEKVIAYLKELEFEVPTEILMQLIPAPELQERPVKVTVSFKKTALELIDNKAEKYGFTRSGFLVKAAEAFGG